MKQITILYTVNFSRAMPFRNGMIETVFQKHKQAEAHRIQLNVTYVTKDA